MRNLDEEFTQARKHSGMPVTTRVEMKEGKERKVTKKMSDQWNKIK